MDIVPKNHDPVKQTPVQTLVSQSTGTRSAEDSRPPDSSGGRTRSAPSQEDVPSFSSDDLACITNYLQTAEGKKDCKRLKRGDMLPYLFKLRGQPMSLKDHIQFHAMYSNEYAADTLFLCGRQVGKCGQKFTKTDHFAQRYENGCRIDSPDSVTEVMASSPTRTVRRSVLEVQHPGLKPLVKIVTRLGSELRVSREHRLMQYGGA
jgi:hypothetical protein